MMFFDLNVKALKAVSLACDPNCSQRYRLDCVHVWAQEGSQMVSYEATDGMILIQIDDTEGRPTEETSPMDLVIDGGIIKMIERYMKQSKRSKIAVGIDGDNIVYTDAKKGIVLYETIRPDGRYPRTADAKPETVKCQIDNEMRINLDSFVTVGQAFAIWKGDDLHHASIRLTPKAKSPLPYTVTNSDFHAWIQPLRID